MAGERPGGRARRRLGALLGTVGVVALLATLVSGYVESAIFDSDEFADRASSALTDDAVKQEIALKVTDDVVLRAERDLVALRPVIQSATESLIGGSAFRSLFRASVADLHRSVFDREATTVTLTLANLGVILQTALERLDPSAAERVPHDIELIDDTDPPPLLTTLVQTAEDIQRLTLWLALVALVGCVAALVLSPNRRESLRRGGIGVAVGALLLLVVYWVAHARVLGQFSDPDLRAALGGVWDAYLLDLRDLLMLTAGCGAVVAAAAASVLRPLNLEGPLRRGWTLALTTPRDPRLRALRALALIAVGALIVADPIAVLRILAVVAGIVLIYVGVQELLRLVVKPAPPDVATAGRRLLPRNALLAGGAAALAIVAAGSLFVATGGVSQGDVELAGCNGHRDLCDRTLPEVTFPAAHNAFSAADNPGWLFAQHEAGIAAQLRGGVRGFLIDTYWGRRAPDGRVITDLADDANLHRQELVEEFGAQAVDAALAVRDSVSGREAADGPRDIYLCHGFCEVGARLLRSDLEAMRDFLVANPHQVLVVINQNEGVGPREFAREVERSGLIDFVYRGTVEEWPTLGEMIERNERVLMLAEKPPFDVVPWYHAAYELGQETPYHFTRPEQLTDPKLLPASCAENRGHADAPIFLVNHWIDTSPAPRPSNAAVVNARKPLLRRARECSKLRGRHVTLLAVDFWRTGDLFEVADVLNGVESR